MLKSKFKNDTLYKHKANTDVAFMKKVFIAADDEGVSLAVTWWNIVHEPFSMGRTQVIRIVNEQLENWQEFIPGVSNRYE